MGKTRIFGYPAAKILTDQELLTVAGALCAAGWVTFNDFITSPEGIAFLAEQNLPERDPKFEVKYSFSQVN